MGLAERADVIVDFTNVPVGNYVLGNVGPDEPFGGGEPGDDFDVADPDTTGQIMQFRVVPGGRRRPDHAAAVPRRCRPIAPLPGARSTTRPLALIEMMSMFTGTVRPRPCSGTVDADGMPMHQMWMDAVTENPSVGDTEVWEFYNTTADAHPMHVHEVTFEVVNRQALVLERGRRDRASGPARRRPAAARAVGDAASRTPSSPTRARSPASRRTFDTPGQFVWHCHIVEHEDNEMMRPYRIGPVQPGQPAAGSM